MQKVFARTTSALFITPRETWEGAISLCRLNGGSLLSDITHSQWTKINGAVARAADYFPISIWLGGKVNEDGVVVWSQSSKLISNQSFGEDQILKGNCLVGLVPGISWSLQSCTEYNYGVCIIPDQAPFDNCESNNSCPTNASCFFPDDNSNKKACICDDGFEKQGRSP